MLQCRYAEYETKLELLRAHRKELLGLQGKTTLADYSIVKRIHLIYERATRKFRGDLRVWLKWLHFCKSSGSTRQISRVSPSCRCLNASPTSMFEAVVVQDLHMEPFIQGRCLTMRDLQPHDQTSTFLPVMQAADHTAASQHVTNICTACRHQKTCSCHAAPLSHSFYLHLVLLLVHIL